jgi:hypothetical protein
MAIIFSKEILAQLEIELGKTKDDVQVISAFCKEPALAFVQDRLADTVSHKRLLVRFTLADILAGATDAGLYQFCQKHGWDMYVQFNLHAKTYIFDRKRCLIGSANTTGKGIGLSANANIEISAISDIEQGDLVKIDALFSTATKLDADLYAKMCRDIENAVVVPKEQAPVWGADILVQVKDEAVSSLFSYEFPAAPFADNISNNSFDFLNIDQEPATIDEVKTAFTVSRAYKWLLQTLQNADGHELYFGALTVELHNALVSDPMPYRKEVKDLLANLLAWVGVLATDTIAIDIHGRYSQRIRLV